MKSFDKCVLATRKGVVSRDEITLEDLTWACANSNRFNGHPDRQVSILAHSLHCYHIAKIAFPLNYPLQKYMLFHDIPEGYTGDITTYVKRDILTPAALAKLHAAEDAILNRLGVDLSILATHKTTAKSIDHNALAIEAEYGFDNFDYREWPKPEYYDDIDIIKMYAPLKPRTQIAHFMAAIKEVNSFIYGKAA